MKVSLILAAFDRPEFLARELKQITEQTLTDWECLMLDEASDDRNKIVVEKINDPRIKWSKVERNGDWGYKVKEEAAKSSYGEYLCFGSDDNEYKPDFFEKMSAELDKGFDLVVCDFTDARFPTGFVGAAPSVGSVNLGSFMVKSNVFNRLGWGPINCCTDGEFVQRVVADGCTWTAIYEQLYIHH